MSEEWRARPKSITERTLAAARSPWEPYAPDWAMLELGSSAVDTQIDDPFIFVERRRPLIIGRAMREDEVCDIRIRDEGVSRAHCELRHENGSWRIKHLAEDNYTIVDRDRVPLGQDVVLGDESTIIINNTRLRFRHPTGTFASASWSICRAPETGLPGPNIVRQVMRLAARREQSCHVALFSLAGGGYAGAEEEVEAFRSFHKHLADVARMDTPAGTFVGQAGQLGSSHTLAVAVIFRSIERAAVEELVRGWHGAIRSRAAFAACNVALVTPAGPYDDAVGQARQKLVQAEFLGNGVAVTSDVSVYWDRTQEIAFRHRIASWPTVGLGVLVDDARTADSPALHAEVRRAIAEGIERLPAGSTCAVAWGPRSSLWYIGSKASRTDVESALRTPLLRMFFRKDDRDVSSWLTEKAAELEARRRDDPARMSTPFLQVSHVPKYGEADRFLARVTGLETLLRLVCSTMVARLASAWSDAHEPDVRHQLVGALQPALEELADARHATDGPGTQAHLIGALVATLPDEVTIPAVRDLFRNRGFLDLLHAAIDARKVVHYNGSARGHAEAADKIGAVMLATTRALVSPDFQLVRVLSSTMLRRGPNRSRVEIIRLLDSRPRDVETVERPEQVDAGVWFAAPDRWTPLHPWMSWRECEDCGREDLFSISAISASADRLRYLPTIDRHIQGRAVEEPDPVVEYVRLLRAADEVMPARTKTLPGSRRSPRS